MTKEEALKWSELFKAYTEGKQIQISNGYSWFDLIFTEAKDLIKYGLIYLRIKPDPKYIPYTWDDWKEFMGRTIYNKETRVSYLIIGLCKSTICIDSGTDSEYEGWVSYDFLYGLFLFENGTPFGKLVEE